MGRVVFADVLNGMDVIDVQGADVDTQTEASLGDITVIEGEYTVPDHIARSGNMGTNARQAADEPAARGQVNSRSTSPPPKRSARPGRRSNSGICSPQPPCRRATCVWRWACRW